MTNSVKTDGFPGKGSHPPLSGRQLQVLHLLAVRGPMSTYQAKKESDLLYSVAHVSIKHLERRGLVKLESEEKGKKGMAVKTYGLTVRGVAAAFNHTQVRSEMAAFARMWGRLLPLVLGKWTYLTKMGVGDEALKRFIMAAGMVETGSDIPPYTIPMEKPKDPAEVFTRLFYRPDLQEGGQEDWERWVRTLNEDPDLKAYMTGLLSFLGESYDSMARVFKHLRGVHGAEKGED